MPPHDLPEQYDEEPLLDINGNPLPRNIHADIPAPADAEPPSMVSEFAAAPRLSSRARPISPPPVPEAAPAFKEIEDEGLVRYDFAGNPLPPLRPLSAPVKPSHRSRFSPMGLSPYGGGSKKSGLLVTVCLVLIAAILSGMAWTLLKPPPPKPAPAKHAIALKKGRSQPLIKHQRDPFYHPKNSQ